MRLGDPVLTPTPRSPCGLSSSRRAVSPRHARAALADDASSFLRPAPPLALSPRYGYFAEAARLGDSGDSLYNAGYCLEHGLGAPRDLGAATEMFERARALTSPRSALRAQPRLYRG